MKLRPSPPVLRWIALLAFALPLAPPAHAAAATAPPQRVIVFAAASLAESFTDLGRTFEASHAGTTVRFSFLGSQVLAAQLAQGAPADVFASADGRSMDAAVAAHRIDGEPAVFAQNKLVVIVPRTNPGRIGRLQDLARHGIKLVIGAEAVPVGRYSREMLAHLAQSSAFGADFARRALSNVVSEEENVKAVVSKVQLGEADAGIVYRSDVTSAVRRYVTTIAVPDDANVLASYPIAAVTPATSPELAHAFVDLVHSAAGQKVLAAHGLLPAATTAP
jgi:molybdate transport system substrate-binding protein